MKELLKRLTSEFEDGEYAHAYMESHAVSKIAAQIYALRKQRGLTQKQLAEKAGIAQERISKIESGDFSSLTMSTLQKFARAFDVDVNVCFRAFSEGVMDVVTMSAERLKVKERQADLAAFCLMTVNERQDGSLIAYSIPDGMASIVFTGAPEPPGSTVTPTVSWQQLLGEVPITRRAATC